MWGYLAWGWFIEEHKLPCQTPAKSAPGGRRNMLEEDVREEVGLTERARYQFAVLVVANITHALSQRSNVLLNRV